MNSAKSNIENLAEHLIRMEYQAGRRNRAKSENHKKDQQTKDQKKDEACCEEKS